MQYLISYDMNGPLTRTDTSALVPHEGVRDAIASLPVDDDDIEIAINSGYDIDTLRHFRDDVIEQAEMHLIGEMGSVYEDATSEHGVEQIFREEPEADLINLKQRLYEQAAREGRKIHEQGNYSSTVGCTRVEAEGSPEDPRGEVYRHHAFDEDVRTKDIYDSLPDNHFEFEDERIEFDPENIMTVAILADKLRYDHTFTGVRFTETEEGIGVHRDPDDADISLDEAHEFMEHVLEPTLWSYQHNPDWGTDYMKDLDLSKQHGANHLAEHLFDGEYTVIHVGDKPGDVMNGTATFFAIDGSEAETYCEANDISYTAVADGVEFTDHVLDIIDDTV